MTIFKRTMISIIRQMSKTLLLFGIVVLLSLTVITALTANRSMNQTYAHILRNLPVIVTLSIDMDLLIEAHPIYGEEAITIHASENLTTFNGDLIRTIGSLPHVDAYDYSYDFSLFSPFDRYEPEGMLGWTEIGSEYLQTIFLTIGVSRAEIIHFEAGLLELYEGRLFVDSEMMPLDDEPTPLLMSREVAQLNGLDIGDVFSLYRFWFEPLDDVIVPEGGFTDLTLDDVWQQPDYRQIYKGYNFQLIGTWEIDFQNVDAFRDDVTYNTFFIPNWKAERLTFDWIENERFTREFFNILEPFPWEGVHANAFFILESPYYLDAFVEAATPLLPEFFYFEDFFFLFDPLIISLNPVQVLANQILIFAIGSMLLVLMLLILLYLRDRKHELSVYLALGEKKVKIIVQLIMEVGIVYFLGMTVSVLIGNIIASEFSRLLLRNEVSSAMTSSEIAGRQLNMYAEMFGMIREFTLDELIAFSSVSLDGGTIVLFYVIGLVTVILATIAPALYILELNVKDTLTQGKIG